MSDQHTKTYDDADLEWEHEEEDTPPPRLRRRLLTPVSGGLAAVVLLAGGFVAGVQVQKGQEDSAGAGARAGGFAARTGGTQGSGQGQAAAGGGTASAGATAGTVANVKGTTLYVTGTDGTTVKVRTNDNSTVTRNAGASVSSVHPGDTVVVQGAENANGTVTATSITATAKGVSAFDGLAALGGGASGVPQGFAPPQG